MLASTPQPMEPSKLSSKNVQVGLAVGESFAEVASVMPPFQTRWSLAKKSLTDGLKDTLASIDGDSSVVIHYASDVVERSIKKGQGQAPALIVASGFESWLRLRQPLTSLPFTLEPARANPPVDRDSVFGISLPIRTEELEFLASKFELSKIKAVVIALPHANRESKAELEVAAFFQSKGLKTFVSHSLPLAKNADPVERWAELSQLAFASLAVEEEREQIEIAREGAEVVEWRVDARGVRGGLAAAIATAAGPDPVLHLGLDHFYLVVDGCIKPLGFGAAQGLTLGEWSFPGLSDKSVGLEPGPMLFGKSQQLAILDILFVQDRLQPIEDLSGLINEKSRPRILESLLAWGKTAGLSTGVSRLDPRQVAEDIEAVFIDRLAEDALTGLRGRVVVQGAFASTLHPLLKKRRPDLELVLPTDAEWAEARACLKTPPGAHA